MSGRSASEDAYVKKTIVKSFRLDEKDDELFKAIHDIYLRRHQVLVNQGNMLNIHRWTPANTLQTLIRDTYVELLGEDVKRHVE